MEFEFSKFIFKKFSNINFNENSSSGSSVVLYGQTDIIKLIFTFQNFVNTSKMNTSEQIADGRSGP